MPSQQSLPASPVMQSITGLSGIIERYDAIIMDLWGVIHDGTHLYPGVREALVSLKEKGVKVIMLSNAPRRAHKVAKVLGELGIEPELYHAVLSSGEAGYHRLAEAPAEAGRRYYYIGPTRDEDVLDGLDFTRMKDIRDADLIINVGFGSEEQSTDDWMPLLREAKSLKVPMLCLNPDLEVVKQTGEHFPCAGVIAHAYQNIGGGVLWFGKPYAEVYEQCMEKLGAIPKSRVLAIGDSLETDIPGAQHFGVDSVLVTGGILRKNTPAQIAAMCHELSLRPTYILPQLVW